MRISDQTIDRVYISSQTRPANYAMNETHYHYYYELYYLKKGTCRFFIKNNQYNLKSGDFLIIPPREAHFNRYLSTCTRINVYFRLQDIATNNKFFLPELGEKFFQTNVIHVPEGSQEIINNIFNSMLAEEKVDDTNTYTIMPLLLKQLFAYFDRYCIVSPKGTTSTNDNDILQAVRFISDNYNTPITLESLADKASLSPTYFSKKFRQVTGMGMKEFLVYTRLKHAAMELLSTKHPITDIALNCGFSNSNYFKDAFKKMYNVSPREYRNTHKTDYLLEKSLINEKEVTQ